MFNPDSRHYEFLEKLASNQTSTEPAPSNIPTEDMNEMVLEALVAEYFNQGSKTRYAILPSGVVALSRRPPKEFVKPDGLPADLDRNDPKVIEAIDFIMSRGYPEQTSVALVAEWGTEYILDSKRKVAGVAQG